MDKNNALILPIIAIHRKSIDISANLGGYGTAIAPRDQELYVVKKRLSKKDRDYQNIINRPGLKSQKNVASRANFASSEIFPGKTAKPGTIATRRNGKNLSYVPQSTDGLLENNLSAPVI